MKAKYKKVMKCGNAPCKKSSTLKNGIMKKGGMVLLATASYQVFAVNMVDASSQQDAGGLRGPVLTAGYDTSQMMAGFVPCTTSCNGPCIGGCTSRTGGPGPGPLQPSNNKSIEANQYNNRGVELYNAGKWKLAIDAFTAALRLLPNDAKMKQNLANAQTELAKEQAAAAQRLKEAKDAEERKQKDIEIANRMREQIQKVAVDIGTLPSSDGLNVDFDGQMGGGGRKPGQTGGSSPLTFMKPASEAVDSDPMVVDLRERLRDSVNMAVVSGGMAPASEAKDLTFMRPGDAASPKQPPPWLQGVSRQIATAPRFQEAHAELVVAHVRKDKALADKAGTLSEEELNRIFDPKFMDAMRDKMMDEVFSEIDRKKKVDDTLTQIHEAVRSELLAANNRCLVKFGDKIDDMRKQGILGEKDALNEKRQTDPKVREATDKALIEYFAARVEEYEVVYKKALEAFAKEMKKTKHP